MRCISCPRVVSVIDISCSLLLITLVLSMTLDAFKSSFTLTWLIAAFFTSLMSIPVHGVLDGIMMSIFVYGLGSAIVITLTYLTTYSMFAIAAWVFSELTAEGDCDQYGLELRAARLDK